MFPSHDRRQLDSQTFERSQIRLLLCDSSQDSEFTDMVKEWLFDSTYKDFRIIPLKPNSNPDLAETSGADVGTSREIQEAVARIYNRAAMALDSQYAVFVEDDVLPPIDVIDTLIRRCSSDVATVSAPYRARQDRQWVVWSGLREDGVTCDFAKRSMGIQEVWGTGFGCILIRTVVLKKVRFGMSEKDMYFDVSWFSRLPSFWKRLVDWAF